MTPKELWISKARTFLKTRRAELDLLEAGKLSDKEKVEWIERVASVSDALAEPKQTPPITKTEKNIEKDLLNEILVQPKTSGLVWVPAVMRILVAKYSMGQLVKAMDILSQKGIVELRPESSILRMKPSDMALCPVAFDGTPLSYLRVLK